jgi:hypothetical protein
VVCRDDVAAEPEESGRTVNKKVGNKSKENLALALVLTTLS